MSDAEAACGGKMIGHRVAEDLQRAFDSGGGRDRRARGPAQVRVVEVGQPVGRRPDLAAHAPLLPGQSGVLGAHPGQQCADGLTVAHHHPVTATHLAGFGADTEPPRSTDQRQRRLGTGAADLQRRGPARLGERSVRQKRSPPSGFGIGDAAADDLGGQAAHRAAAQIEQPGLTRQRLTVLDHTHQVAGALADSGRRHDLHHRVVPVQVVDVLAQPTRDDAQVHFGFDDHPAGDDVQSAGEPQQ